jgi:hypothetical protein
VLLLQLRVLQPITLVVVAVADTQHLALLVGLEEMAVVARVQIQDKVLLELLTLVAVVVVAILAALAAQAL